MNTKTNYMKTTAVNTETKTISGFTSNRIVKLAINSDACQVHEYGRTTEVEIEIPVKEFSLDIASLGGLRENLYDVGFNKLEVEDAIDSMFDSLHDSSIVRAIKELIVK